MSFRLNLFSSVAVFVALLSGFIAEDTAFALPAKTFGLWVESEGKNQPFKSPTDFEQFAEFSNSARFTDLYCQVYRGGRSWFPSLMADDTPYREAKEQGLDPLGETIRLAHSRGQRVHAWINVFNLTRNLHAPLLKVVGPKAVLTDNYGNSILSYDEEGRPPGEIGKYFRLGTPAIWLDPGSERVRQYIVETVRDLIVSYPELDGVHLDMARFPYAIPIKPASSVAGGIDYGYSLANISRFNTFIGALSESVSGKTAEPNGVLASSDARAQLNRRTESQPKINPQELPKGDSWDNWRRVQVGLLVSEVRQLLGEIAPRAKLSAAVLAWPDRAYLSAFQDWRGWLQMGMVDAVMPMSYTRDRKLFGYLSKQAAAFSGNGDVAMGIGAWMMLNENGAIRDQTKRALRAGADGVVLFSYSNMLSEIGRVRAKEVEELLFPLNP